MALAWTVVDGLLEADVLAASEEIESAEGRSRVWRIEDKSPDHPPGAGKVQPVRFGPAKRSKSCAKLPERADESDVDGVTGQPVARIGITRHAIALEHLQAKTYDPRQNDISGQSIGDAQRDHPGKP